MVLNLENYSMVHQIEKDGKLVTYYRHNTIPKKEKKVVIDDGKQIVTDVKIRDEIK